ncbi:MAG: hypothetical protein EA398_16345 [Deltaproteobacteria bacterium]|nr:MAG: hypothetical protein EA398_16345 [Deltaproteobacteria bacterium]
MAHFSPRGCWTGAWCGREPLRRVARWRTGTLTCTGTRGTLDQVSASRLPDLPVRPTVFHPARLASALVLGLLCACRPGTSPQAVEPAPALAGEQGTEGDEERAPGEPGVPDGTDAGDAPAPVPIVAGDDAPDAMEPAREQPPIPVLAVDAQGMLVLPPDGNVPVEGSVAPHSFVLDVPEGTVRVAMLVEAEVLGEPFVEVHGERHRVEIPFSEDAAHVGRVEWSEPAGEILVGGFGPRVMFLRLETFDHPLHEARED